MTAKNILKAFLFVLVLAIPISVLAMPSVYPTGTVVYNPEKCWNGFTLLAGGPPRLIDMNGNLINEWTTGPNGFPAKMLPGGQIISTGVRWDGCIDDGLTVTQLDWDGNTVWEFKNYKEVLVDPKNPEKGKQWISTQHHDIQREGNPVGYYAPGMSFKEKGNTLILGHVWHTNPKINDNLLMDDSMFEVTWDGKIIWEWKAADHFDEYGFDADAMKALKSWKPKKGEEADGFDWWHQNCASYLGPNKWYDQGDKRFHPDNIIFDSREANILCIIDKKTGKVTWKAGPDYLNGDDRKIGQIVGPHHTHMIPKGLPGEGNIMVYDNGGQAGYGKANAMGPEGIANVHRFYSRVLEINPVTKEVVWQYSITTHKKPWKLFGYKDFSPFISSAQRLPNGNTMICEGSNGRFIEVTVAGEIVWEYVSPYPGNIPGTNYVYRAYRVPYEWAPQAKKPHEAAVIPPENARFQLPNVEGVKPNISSTAKAQNLSNASMTGDEATKETGNENTMPAY